MKTELDILKDITDKLSFIDVPYMLTGSLAMMFYAEPRMTRDIDIVIELNNLQIESFINVFKDEYYLSEDAIKDSVNTIFMFNLIHLNSSVKVDFVIKKSDDYRLVEFERRRKINFSGVDLYIVSKEDLIISKLNWAKDSDSELQKRDIRNLLRTEYDNDYLLKWINTLGLYNFFVRVKNE